MERGLCICTAGGDLKAERLFCVFWVGRVEALNPQTPRIFLMEVRNLEQVEVGESERVGLGLELLARKWRSLGTSALQL